MAPDLAAAAVALVDRSDAQFRRNRNDAMNSKMDFERRGFWVRISRRERDVLRMNYGFRGK
ncbi:hypothetical protein Syun_023654 [Stephania yunnanensis]|uniref:Uncharacterized protein n=1 Tax=Stephania yunnanensis TaxID=152371 RepID=A0AAP0FHJ3_9MAGN